MEVFIKKIVEFIFSPFFFMPAIVFAVVAWKHRPNYFIGYAFGAGFLWHCMYRFMMLYSKHDGWKFSFWDAIRINLFEQTIAFTLIALAVYGLIRLVRTIIA